MQTTATRVTHTQLEAITAMHEHGALFRSRDVLPELRDAARFSQRTLDALVAAGLATHDQPSAQAGITGSYRSTIRTWADGHGTWHATVPEGPSAAAVARAAIRGEIHARQAARGWTLHVTRETTARSPKPGTVTYAEA